MGPSQRVEQERGGHRRRTAREERDATRLVAPMAQRCDPAVRILQGRPILQYAMGAAGRSPLLSAGSSAADGSSSHSINCSHMHISTCRTFSGQGGRTGPSVVSRKSARPACTSLHRQSFRRTSDPANWQERLSRLQAQRPADAPTAAASTPGQVRLDDVVIEVMPSRDITSHSK